METSSTKTRDGVTDEQPVATPAAERKGEAIPVAVAAQGCCGTVGSGAGCCGPTAMPTPTDNQGILTTVRQHYGTVAIEVLANNTAGCCGSACCGSADNSSITQDLYLADELEGLPLKAALASLGCGNPTALAELRAGEVVLDLGSGGGIDVLLSARRVGPTAKAYGLDMTDEMLALAEANKRKAGVENVEFLKGEIEQIPLPDNSVDVILSNCVINLSADKGRVLREAFRVLKPGGRFAVSDIVTRGEIRPEIRQSVLLWVGCVAGALTEDEYRSKLAAAGFEQIEIEATRIYRAEDARDLLSAEGIDVDAIAPEVDGRFMSAFIRAVKPLPRQAVFPDVAGLN